MRRDGAVFQGHSGWIGILVASLLTTCAPAAPSHRRAVVYYTGSGDNVGAATPPHNDSALNALPSQSDLGPSSTTSCAFEPGQIFDAEAPWNQRIDTQSVASDSDAVVAFLGRTHTSKHRFQTDFGFVTLNATSATPKRSFTRTNAHYEPDCDTDAVPIVPGGRIEGEQGYACEGDGDCHLLVHVPEECRLYEMWRANITEGGFFGGCLASWDTRMNYGSEGRGRHCTSADASGMPITPLLFTPQDLARGTIKHALRLVLPNQLIRSRIFVAPATHSTPATKGPDDAPPYGARFRLKANVDTSRLSPGGKVVAQALKSYGMIIADGGLVSFTAVDDADSAIKWSTFGFGPLSMTPLIWSDFELVDAGPRYRFDQDCVRK